MAAATAAAAVADPWHAWGAALPAGVGGTATATAEAPADDGEEEFLADIAVAAWYLPPVLVEAGWRVYVDPGSDQTYYYNLVTEEAVFDV